MSIIDDFFLLMFPRICLSCGNSLWKHEEVICLSCDYHLPRTNFHLSEDNPVSRLFWGRVKLEGAASYLYFNKGNRVQRLIHSLKYKGRKDVGSFLGRQYGQHLSHSTPFKDADVIVPLPLHAKRYTRRGYNQSACFASGLGETMGIPVLNDILIRKKETETQTKKSRFRRWANVAGVFEVTDPVPLKTKHILLVDDVITTGATLEACAQVLYEVYGTRISVVTLAIAPC